MKLIKFIILGFLLVGFLTSCAKNDDNDWDEPILENYLPGKMTMNISHPEKHYYYYYEEKIHLTKMVGKFFVVFYTTYEDKLMNELALAGIESSQMEKVQNGLFNSNYLPPIGSGLKIFTGVSGMIIEGDYSKATSALAYTLYWAPYYVRYKENGRESELGMTHIIMTQLKPGTDMKQVKSLAKEYSVEIMGADEYLDGLYYFACTNRSMGNSLLMSTIFQESGLFEHSEPDIIMTLIPHNH